MLRGKALQDALLWASDKSLNYQDREFLAASQTKEKEEAIAAREKEAQLSRERKDKEAVEKRNLLLSEANKKAQRRISIGSIILLVTVLGAITSVILGVKQVETANNKVNEADIQVDKAKQELAQAQKQAKEAQQSEGQAQRNAEQARLQEKEARKSEKVAQQRVKKADNIVQEAKRQEKTAKESASRLEQDARQTKQELATAQGNLEEKSRELFTTNEQLTSAKKQEAEFQKQLQKLNSQLQTTNIKNKEIKIAVETVQKLSKLAGDLRNENLTDESDEALRLAGLSFNIQNYKLKQALLLASISQAARHLKKRDEAQQEIKESQKFLSQVNENIITSNEGLQIQVLVNESQGAFLAEKKEINPAIKSYKTAFDILKNYSDQTSPFRKNNQLIAAKNIESIHRSLIDLLSTNTTAEKFKKQVEKSLTQHLYAQLEYFLKAKNWQEADRQTDRLILNIAKREKERIIDIESINNFSCLDLQKIDKLWVASDKRFGFSVQKEIYIETGNKLGISPENWNDEDLENYTRFAKAVGWYDEKARDNDDSRSRGGWVNYGTLMLRIKDNPQGVPSGVLPYLPFTRLQVVFTINGYSGNNKLRFLLVLFSRCDL